MIDLKKYPLALQLLMKTDGTVTELIKLLAAEDLEVIKLLEELSCIDNKNILNREIFLQGKSSSKNWLFAQSKIYLDNLPKEFVDDLLLKSIPIGTLWTKFRVETFKLLINQKEEVLDENMGKGFKKGDRLLSRVYHVFNKQKIIMEITEKFSVTKFQNLL